MSIIPRQTTSRLIRSARLTQIRTLQTTPSLSFADSSTPPSDPSTPPPSKSSRFSLTKLTKALPSTPYTVTQAPQFPAPNDPFSQASKPVVSRDGKTSTPVPVTSGSGARGGEKYSDTTKAVVRGVARLLGYNSKASTAIRETGRMMRGIVESIERDRDYWYGQCGLPPTYQTFFQLHLLYVLILLPRLRALAVTASSTTHEIPEPLDPSQPTHDQPHHPTPNVAEQMMATSASASSASSSSSPSTTQTSISSPSSTSAAGILVRPDHVAYPSEILNHFFELAESEMRKVLGRGERERVVKKYMSEMGEQWKGAGAGLDYVMGLSLNDPTSSNIDINPTSGGGEIGGKEDIELASWVWRNLYASQGLTAGPIVPSTSEGEGPGTEIEIVQRLEEAVKFIRREMARLDQVDDVDVLDGNIGEWGQAKSE